MKRYGNLWPHIIDFENLLQAARQAQRGKRYRPNVLAFNQNLDRELLRLQQELTQKTYRPGGYRVFRIEDPKPRMISAAPYRDRVVHHALRKYFPSIDHSILKAILRRKLKCPDTLWLIDAIIDGSNPQGGEIEYSQGTTCLRHCSAARGSPLAI